MLCLNECVYSSYFKKHTPHPRHVHEHDPRVDPCPAVKRVAGEAVVPSNTWLFVFWGHGSQLGGVKLWQESPEAVYGLQEEDVRIHVHNGVHVLEDELKSLKKTHRDRCWREWIIQTPSSGLNDAWSNFVLQKAFQRGYKSECNTFINLYVAQLYNHSILKNRGAKLSCVFWENDVVRMFQRVSELTGKKSLWEAQGLKSFFHSTAFSLGKLIEYTV